MGFLPSISKSTPITNRRCSRRKDSLSNLFTRERSTDRGKLFFPAMTAARTVRWSDFMAHNTMKRPTCFAPFRNNASISVDSVMRLRPGNLYPDKPASAPGQDPSPPPDERPDPHIKTASFRLKAAFGLCVSCWQSPADPLESTSWP